MDKVQKKERRKWIPPLKKWTGHGKKPGAKPNYRMRWYWKHLPKKKRGPAPLPPKNYKYEIILTSHGKEQRRIAQFESKREAEKCFNGLKKKVNNVVFPQITVTTKPIVPKAEGSDTINECIAARYEYVLIEKSDKESIVQRNMYGKFVEQKVSKEGWRILDKTPFQKEEKFAVHGYDSRKDRKTFTWIWENIAMDGEFKRIYILGRFIILKNDDESMDVITCKNKENVRRFYNLLMDYTTKYKVKHLLFYGEYGRMNEKGRRLAEEVLEATGWSEEHLHAKR